MIDERSGMGAVGDMGKFVQFKAAKAMEKAAEKGGEASSGMGMGMGAGHGHDDPRHDQPGHAGLKAAGSQPGRRHGRRTKKCPTCQKEAAGRPSSAPSAAPSFPKNSFCSHCGSALKKGAKFCPECGQKTS